MSSLKRHERAALVGLGAAMVLVIAWYLALWRPEASSLRAARTTESQAATQVASDEGQIVSLRADGAQVAKAKAVLHRLVEAVPDGPSLDQMLSTINRAAASSGVSLTSVGTPTPSGWPVGSSGATTPTTGTGPSSISLSLGVTGSQAGVLGFIRALDAQPRLYVVSSFGLGTPTAGGAPSSTTLTVEAFFKSAASGIPTFPGD